MVRQKGGGMYADPEKALARITSGHQVNLEDQMLAMSTWPTPCARDGMPAHSPEYVAEKKAQGHGMANLNDYMAMSSWPTPTVADVTGGRKARSGLRSNEPLLNGLMHGADTFGGTPRASDGEKGGPNQSFSAGGQPLPAQMHGAEAKGSPWATPAARDYRHPNAVPLSERGGGKKGEQLPNQMAHLAPEPPLGTWPTPQAMDGNKGSEPPRSWDTGVSLPQRIAQQHSGQAQTDSSATTAKRGAPNPAFPCWLMGYGVEWLLAAPSEKQTTRKQIN